MPKDFIWGPVRDQKDCAGAALLSSDTPQVLFWACISDFIPSHGNTNITGAEQLLLGGGG
jgi:hypothetical protein